MSEDKFLSDYSPRDAVWDTQRTLTDSVGGIYQTAAEFERYALRMASCSGLLRFGCLPSWKPEKRAYGFVVRNFAVSVIALSASGEEPSCGKPVFIRLYRKSLWITRLPDGCF